MGIIVNNLNDRSELQKRIAAELNERSRKNSKDVMKSKKIDLEPEDIDGVVDSEYIKGYSQSKTLNLDKTWLTLIAGVVVVAIVIIILAVVG